MSREIVRHGRMRKQKSSIPLLVSAWASWGIDSRRGTRLQPCSGKGIVAAKKSSCRRAVSVCRRSGRVSQGFFSLSRRHPHAGYDVRGESWRFSSEKRSIGAVVQGATRRRLAGQCWSRRSAKAERETGNSAGWDCCRARTSGLQFLVA